MTAAPTRPTIPTAPKPPALAARSGIQFAAVPAAAGHRVLLYGPGGIGKTTLAANFPGSVVFFDLDESLGRLRDIPQVRVVPGVNDWASLRSALQAPGWDGVDAIVIDSLTKAEELAVADTLLNIKHEKGHTCKSVEDYGYGKGYGFVFDTFLPLLGDLDRHCRAGRNVLLVCHDCTCNVPNPAGEDWLRYEPRLQSPTSGKASIRLRVREWADHVLFIGYDVAVNKDGKGQGAGTRTLYPSELPHCMAKSRTCRDQMQITEGTADVWSAIVGK